MQNSKKRNPLWLPYTREVKIKKNQITFIYKGGECTTTIDRILFIMFYGNTCALPDDFLQLCVRYSVPLCIHRRTMPHAVWITPSIRTSAHDDILTKQILFRDNEKKRVHITRKLLTAKFKSMEWLTPFPSDFLKKNLSIPDMVQIEARHAKRYWKKYFDSLGEPLFSRRGKRNYIKSVLDAISKLSSGIFLRYILYHRLSPYHGFLHIPSDYPSLVYDLMEPYRGYIEKIVFEALIKAQNYSTDEKKTLAHCIACVEDYFDTEVYVGATRQIVTVQELFHGIVLALRSYLHGTSRQFIIPSPSKPNGGRPVNAGYRLYGRGAGPTDFWEVARTLS